MEAGAGVRCPTNKATGDAVHDIAFTPLPVAFIEDADIF
mgnify:FL=1